MLSRSISLVVFLTISACSGGSFKKSSSEGSAQLAAAAENAAKTTQSQDAKTARDGADAADYASKSSSTSTKSNCETEHETTAAETQHHSLALHDEECDDEYDDKSASSTEKETHTRSTEDPASKAQ